MKRFLTFLFAASALLAGGCSDSDTDDPAPPEAPAPVIKLPEAVAASPLSVSPEGGTSWFEYEVENPVEGEAIAASTTDAWVHSFDYSVSGRIGFSFDPSEGEVRIANVALTYKGAEKKVVTLLQPVPETPELTFDIRVSGIDGSSAVVAWTPSDDTASYVPMVVEKSLFDSYATEADYIRSDIEYIQGQADLAGKTFAEMLDMFLTTGPTGEQTISGLASDTDYYAYAYGMTAEGVATSAISKTEFRTGPFSCEFAIAHEETESTCDVEVTPSNTGCFYYFDLAAKADFDTWGTDAEIVASVVADLKETAAYYQASGYDLDWTDFLSIGPDGYEFTKLTPDTEYVVYAFALTEEGRPLTGVTRETVRTEAFVPTDDCTFGISFRNVSVTAFDISVRPSNAATRYYIGVCSKELFDKNTPSSIADAFIEMENGYEIDWAGNEYIWTGDVTVDTDADLAMGDLDAGTDYVAVVFGVSTEGVRTTEVASAVQRTSELVPSTMTIGLNVRDVTASGAKFDVTPSNTDEVYFADVFVYDEYTAYDEGKEAYAEVYMDILKAYGLFDYSLYSGNRTVDFTDMLEPSTTYVAVAFGYNGGRTTKIFESEPFTTSAAASGTVAKTVRSRRHGSLGAFRPERRSIEKRLSVDAGSPRGTLARFSSVADLRELPSQGLRGEPSDAAGLRLRRF